LKECVSIGIYNNVLASVEATDRPSPVQLQEHCVHTWGSSVSGSPEVLVVSNEAVAVRELFHSLQLIAQALERRLCGASVDAVLCGW